MLKLLDPNRQRQPLVLKLLPQTVNGTANRLSSNCFPKLASQRLDAASAFRRDADASQSAPPTDIAPLHGLQNP
jgi:hypothetical protein